MILSISLVVHGESIFMSLKRRHDIRTLSPSTRDYMSLLVVFHRKNLEEFRSNKLFKILDFFIGSRNFYSRNIECNISNDRSDQLGWSI